MTAPLADHGDSAAAAVSDLLAGPLAVREGEATLFLVDLGPGGEPLRRRPVISLPAPAVIAVGPPPPGKRWHVGPGLQSRLEPLGGALTAADREAAVHTVTALGRALYRSAPPPGIAVVRLASRPAYVSSERGAMTDQPLWVVPVEGELTLAGRPLPAAGIPLPAKVVVRGGRFTAAAGRPLEQADDATFVAGLRWLTWLVASLVTEELHAADRRDAALAADAEDVARAAESAAVRLLADEITTPGASRVQYDADPFLACARTVGAAAGLELVGPEGGLGGREGAEAVRAVAVASRVFTRRVTLTGTWWQGALDPVLSWRHDGSPVALLPERDGMRLVDAAGASRVLDEAVAAEVLDVGFVFTEPLTDERVTARTLADRALRGNRRELRRWALWVALVTVVSLSVPLAAGVVFGEIIPDGDTRRLAWLVGVLVVVALANVPLQLALTASRVRIEATGSFEVQRSLWGRVLRSPVSIVDRFGPGDLMMRLWALETSRDRFEGAVLGAAPTLAAGAIAAVLLLWTDVALAAIVIAVGLVLLVGSVLLGRRAALEQEAVERAAGEVNGFLLQVLLAIPKLRVAAAESRAFLAWADRFRGAVGRRLLRAAGTNATFNSAITPIGMFALFAAAMVIGPAELGVGAFIAFQTTFGTYLAGVGALSSTVSTVVQLRPTLRRAIEVTEVGTEVDGRRIDPGRLDGSVSVVDVTYRYVAGSRPVLDGLSLRVEPSEMVAIVGASGCGKSTLLRVLLGFARPEAGSVLYDDTDLSSLDVEAVRRQIGVVLQDGQLLPGTVRQNLSGVANLTTEEVWELAETVGLAADLKLLPMGLDTMVTMASGSFSGGQRQRLLIARALATRPRILLLDEATSALDNVTQKIVTDNLARLGMTRIVVAHRLSTLVDADRIVVLDRGRVAEEGTYDELMRRSGAFANLASRQLL